MAYSDFRPLLHCLWVLSLVFAWTAGKTMNGIVPAKEYFPEVDSDLTKITWAHAVNSRAKLQKALEGPVMMLEADILMGKKKDEGKDIPIMAHPPDKVSDLSFEDFLSDVIKAVGEKKQRKGIKLDFKEISALVPVLKMLQKKITKGLIEFPVWINADILKGPVNATGTPLEAKEFIKQAKKYTPNATLSIGWTTRYGTDDSKETITVGQYEEENIAEMLSILTEAGIDGTTTEITFPVRAGIAAQSIDRLTNLIGKVGASKSSLTIWSHPDDKVDMDKLRDLINQVDKEHCYIDVPFSMETGHGPSTSTTTKSPEFDQDHKHDEDCDHDNDSNVDVNSSNRLIASSPFICLASLFIAGLVILLI